MKKQNALYDDASKKIMIAQLKLSSMSKNRIELICDLAKNLNMSKIGLANCIMFSEETKIIEQFLSKHFQIFCVDCKYGRLSKDELFNNGGSRILCNPAGQADYLNSQKTDLNIAIGLCVGHDIIFNAKSEAAVTTLFDKDFTNNNSAALAVESLKSAKVFNV